MILNVRRVSISGVVRWHLRLRLSFRLRMSSGHLLELSFFIPFEIHSNTSVILQSWLTSLMIIDVHYALDTWSRKSSVSGCRVFVGLPLCVHVASCTGCLSNDSVDSVRLAVSSSIDWWSWRSKWDRQLKWKHQIRNIRTLNTYQWIWICPLT